MPEYRFKWRQDTSINWELKNPVLLEGEPGYEEDTGRFKVGNGVSTWRELPHFVPGTGVGGSEAIEALQTHIADTTPHSVYDDGPSLVLLYENAKV